MVESEDVVDDVNALLEMRVGDIFRLEHIKHAYIQNKTIWESDKKYLEQLKEKYLVEIQPEGESSDDPEKKGKTIHCWKCGKTSQFDANFCMFCGVSLFDVGTEKKNHENDKETNTEKRTKFNLKIPIIIAIPVLILAILGVGYSQGFFDDIFEKKTVAPIVTNATENTKSVPPKQVEEKEETVTKETNAKCGTGLVYNPDTNQCVIDN